MFFFINDKTKVVCKAQDRVKARKQFGMSHNQAMSWMSDYHPLEDKKAIIPSELEKDVADFKERVNCALEYKNKRNRSARLCVTA